MPCFDINETLARHLATGAGPPFSCAARPQGSGWAIATVDGSTRPQHLPRCVRMCANRAVAVVHRSSLLLGIRSQDPHQSTAAHQIRQIEGLAVAISWGFKFPPSVPPLELVVQYASRPELGTRGFL